MCLVLVEISKSEDDETPKPMPITLDYPQFAGTPRSLIETSAESIDGL